MSFIEITTLEKQIQDNPEFYSKCVHRFRPDVNHVCSGWIEQEHSFSRACGGDSKALHPLAVPVCSPMNHSPSKADKAWSRLATFEVYGLEQMKKLCSKKDWEQERRLAESFFN